MQVNQKCIICGNSSFERVLKINNAASSVGKLLKKDEIKTDKKEQIVLQMCTRCKLCQLKKNNFVEQDYYEDYQMGVSFSRQMQHYQRWQANGFCNFFGLKGKRVFEVGCGDGMFGFFLKKLGLAVIGVEPSKSFYAVAKRKIRVINQYFNKNTTLKRKYYDAFVVRQVFEHLSNPNQILQDVKLFLKPDGVGLIEVPSFSTAVKDSRYYDIFRDHFAYYTKYTLQYLLSINNFQVLKIFHSANNEYLTAYFKNNEYFNNSLKLFSDKYTSFKKSVRDLLKKYKNSKVAIWGAGGKGVSLLSTCDIKSNDILFVIDSDPLKWNKYTPGSHIFIRAPQEVEFRKIDLILISAVMYQSEIIRDLRQRYDYKNKIGILVPRPHII